MARSDFITVSHKMDWDEILHRSVEAALRNPRLDRNDAEKRQVRDVTSPDRKNRASHKQVEFIPPVPQPLRPPPAPPKPSRLDPGIQGVQRNKENDRKLQQLADSPEMLRGVLQTEKERVRNALTECSARDASSEAGSKRKKSGWAWRRKA